MHRVGIGNDDGWSALGAVRDSLSVLSANQSPRLREANRESAYPSSSSWSGSAGVNLRRRFTKLVS